MSFSKFSSISSSNKGSFSLTTIFFLVLFFLVSPFSFTSDLIFISFVWLIVSGSLLNKISSPRKNISSFNLSNFLSSKSSKFDPLSFSIFLSIFSSLFFIFFGTKLFSIFLSIFSSIFFKCFDFRLSSNLFNFFDFLSISIFFLHP